MATTRDQTRRYNFEMGWGPRPKTLRCVGCKKRFPVPRRGRLPSFCSGTCRQNAYVKRKYGRPGPVAALSEDLGHARVRAFIRKEIWNVLVAAGWVDPLAPVPRDSEPKRPRPKLVVVPPPDDS